MNTRTALRSAIAIAFAAAGCNGGPDSAGGDCPQQLAAGDIVITEVMANPAMSDEGNEWLEIHNASDTEIDLSQLRLIASKADGTAEKVHVIGGARIEGRGYLVLGGMVEAARPAFVGYTYGNDLGGLGNTGGALMLKCGGSILDKIVYTDAKDGASKSLDGATAPDSIANDDLSKWCDSKTEYQSGSKGTPGAPNENCGGVAMTGTCKGGDGVVRSTVGPTAGQLVITELMADPSTDDGKSEWIEIAVLADVDLNGLQAALSSDPAALKPVADFAQLDCIRAAAGSRILLVKNKDTTVNGEIPGSDAAYVTSVNLTNAGATLSVGVGGVIVDSVAYPKATAGASHALDPDRIDAAQNDDLGSWCKGTDTYGAGGKGTPGTANPPCGGGSFDGGVGDMAGGDMAVSMTQCMDGALQRAKVVPAMGDIQITEIMPDPSKVGDTQGEWFELLVKRDVDLHGLQLGSTLGGAAALPGNECRRVTAGTRLIFAKGADPMVNGGLPAIQAWQTFSFGLTNSGGTLVVAAGGAAVDQYTWGASTAGQSWSRDPVNAATWCKISDAGRAYNGTDRGTPGAVNPACP